MTGAPRTAVHTAALAALLGAAACGDTPTSVLPPLQTLPPDLAAVDFEVDGAPTAPYTLLEIRHDEGFRGLVAVDGGGRPVWLHRTQGSPSGSTQRANGNIVVIDSERGLVEIGPRGVAVNELPQEPRPGRFIHHDVTATRDRTLLFLAQDTRVLADTMLTGEAVWEWAPELGAVERRWSSFDHLDPELDHGERSSGTDWLHANSLSVGPRQNVVVSLHFLNQVISIAPGWGSLEWRLGGVRATHAVDDPFSGQHTAAEVDPGHVLLFDNGFEREDARFSRALELEVRPDLTGVPVWEWRPEADNWARIISSARRLTNGNTVVGFGLPENPEAGSNGIEVYEVTRAGEVVWRLRVRGLVSSMYRATPLFDLPRP